MANSAQKHLTVITTCKNRLHHLQQTLPLLVTQPCVDIVVVDYGCPQGSAHWVRTHYPQVRVVEVTDDPGFSAARARNFGARAASSQWLLFIDADILLKDSLSDWVGSELYEGHYYITPARGSGLTGSFFCERSAFERVGGYDEAFRGWGGDDDDIYFRLDAVGVLQKTYPEALFSEITHSDAERFAYDSGVAEKGGRQMRGMMNLWYRIIKYDLSSIIGKPLQSADLKVVRKLVEDAMEQAVASNNNPGEIYLDLGERMDVTRFHGIKFERRLIYKISPRSPEK